MFLTKQTPPPPPPEANGIEIKVKLSESTLVKLIPIATVLLVGAGLVGAGVWEQTQPADSLPDASEVLPKP